MPIDIFASHQSRDARVVTLNLTLDDFELRLGDTKAFAGNLKIESALSKFLGIGLRVAKVLG